MSVLAPLHPEAHATDCSMPSGGLVLHGITHLSASSLNAYVAQPAAWVMERLLNRRAPVGCAAHRGTASEAGIVMGLLDPAAAIPELRQYGIPQTQVRIDRLIDGIPVPVIGFIDLHWPEHGLTLDIKTTFRVPSEITTSHARQVGIYVHGTNHQARVAYCSPKRIAVYQLTNPAQPVAEAVQIAQRMDRFLAISPDPLALASLLVPDTDHYFYANPIAAAHRREVYGV